MILEDKKTFKEGVLMAHNNVQEQLDQYYAAIKEKDYLLHVIDFKQDIDTSKSKGAQFYVNSQGYLQYFYNKTGGYQTEDCQLLAEGLTREDVDAALPVKYSASRPGWKPNQARPHDRYNVYYVKNDALNACAREADLWGFRSLSANIQHQWYLCEEMEAPKPSEQQSLKAMAEKNLHFRYLMELQPDRVSILPIKDHQAKLDEETFPLSNGLRSMTLLPLDGNRHMIQWGDDLKKTSVPVSEDFIASITNPELAWVLVLRQAELMSPIDPIPRLLSAMGVGGRNGSIHLKPIEVDLKYIEVKTAYTQQVAFEYQKEQSSDEWQPVENQNKIDTSSSATIRMKFTEPSVIYDISITRLKEGLLEEIGAIGRLDFHEAIDQEKSDIYKINEQRDYVEFSHRVVRDLLLEEPKVLAGAVTANEDGTLKCTAEPVLEKSPYSHVTALWCNPIETDGETLACMEFETNPNWVVCLNQYRDKLLEIEFWNHMVQVKRLEEEEVQSLLSKRKYIRSYQYGGMEDIHLMDGLSSANIFHQVVRKKRSDQQTRSLTNGALSRWLPYTQTDDISKEVLEVPMTNQFYWQRGHSYIGIEAYHMNTTNKNFRECFKVHKLSVISLEGDISVLNPNSVKTEDREYEKKTRTVLFEKQYETIKIPIIKVEERQLLLIRLAQEAKIYNLFGV